ncbi:MULTISPECIES: hypothetical protein [unclassified Serratia (in: enterobacteria)]|uniref:hypothetical protein n=1 Tax=unclassified Serratia (in: enterobacteria) TaxID=2647522 RepID=UPI00050804D3|nr:MULTISPECIES: hypothetical protein [unclassified Serratia (in: enterobacteria)]KFK94567.1 hypothetical protein JV45_11625 [Serratia sp. Ag2]KFK95787.1 hypothetical protein IV04_20395 [Serratia sp. Ag1]
MSSKNRITSQQFVDLIIGKELSTSEIMALLRETYPNHTMSRTVVSERLQSMLRSPFVEIEQSGRKNLTKWHLKKVSERYLNQSEKNLRSHANDQAVSDKSLWYFKPEELRACRLHKMFDQALASVRGASV